MKAAAYGDNPLQTDQVGTSLSKEHRPQNRAQITRLPPKRLEDNNILVGRATDTH